MEFHIKTAPTPDNYHKNGCDFCETAWRCFGVREGKLIVDGNMQWLPIPTVVNAAFSCEMNLKAILLLEGKTPPKGANGHNLERLFLGIDEETQEMISRFCMPKDTIDHKNAFLHILQIHRDDFREVRYFIEKSEWQDMSPFTMLTIAENLSTITGALIERKSTGENDKISDPVARTIQ